MKKHYKINLIRWSVMLLMMVFACNAQAQYTAGRIVVATLGDGSATPNSNANQIAISEYSTSTSSSVTSSPLYSVTLPTTGTSAVTASGSGTSEVQITQSIDGFAVGFTGYVANSGTSSVTSGTAARVAGTLNNAGTVSMIGNGQNGLTASTGYFSGNNVRGIVTLSPTSGIVFGPIGNGPASICRMDAPTTNTTLLTTPSAPNTRYMHVYNGRIYASSQLGIFALGQAGASYDSTTNTYSGSYGTSLSGSTNIAVPIKTFLLTSGNISAFAFANDTVLYVTAEQTTGYGVGIYKFAWRNGKWAYRYKIQSFATTSSSPAAPLNITSTYVTRNMCIDRSNPLVPIIYFTVNPASGVSTSYLLKYVDNNSTALNGTAVPSYIASSPTNKVFRGVTFSPEVNTNIPTQIVLGTPNNGSTITAGRAFTLTASSTNTAGNAANVTSATNVTLSVNNSGTLAGTTTRSISNGTSTLSTSYNDLTIASSGTYTLTGTASSGMTGLTAGTTSSFTVLPQATQLTFGGAPNAGVVGTNLTSFKVYARRADNSIETTFPGNCTITVGTGSGAATGVLTNATAAFSNGVATFSTLQFDTQGLLYIKANASNPTLTLNRDSAITITDGSVTYTWNGSADNNYTTAANWTPVRTTPATNDKLIFNSNADVVLDLSSNQSIGQLKILNNSTVNLSRTATSTRTITILGNTGADFIVEAGSSLNITSDAATAIIKIAFGSSATGQIAGTVLLNGTGSNSLAEHQFVTSSLVSGTYQLEVLSGGLVTVGSKYSNSKFVFSSSVNDAVVFRNGSRYQAFGGNYIFGVTGAPNYVVMEQSAVYEYASSTAGLSFGSKQYNGIFEVNTDFTFNNTFSNPLLFNRLRVKSGKVVAVNYGAGTSGTWTVDTLELESNARFLVLNAIPNLVTINKIDAALGSRLQLGSSTSSSSVSFATGKNQVKQLTSVGNNTLTISNSVLVDSVFGHSLATGTTGTIITSSNVTLNSTATSTGYIPVSTGIISGTVTVRKWMDGSFVSLKAPRHISSPVTSTTAVDLTNGSSLSGTDLQSWNESAVGGQGAGWTNITNTSTTLTPGMGYSYRTTGNQFIDLAGTLNNGDVNVGLTRNNSGWNLVGNPYASAIDWSAVYTDNTNFYNAYYRWISLSGTTGQWHGYVNGIPNITGYVRTINNNVDANGFSGANIGSMQGFLIKARPIAPTTCTLTFKNAHRVASSATPNGRIASDNRPALEFVVNAENANYGDVFAMYFEDGASTSFDGNFDATKITLSNTVTPTVYGVVSGSNYAVKGLPVVTTETVMPLMINVPANGNYEFNFKSLRNVDNYNVYLIDNVANTSTLVHTNDVVSFNMNANYSGQRFSIRFAPTSVTSVKGSANAETVTVYPNPATGSTMFINLNNVSTEGDAKTTLVNQLGQVVATSSTQVVAGNQQMSISLNGIASGIYTVTVQTPTQKVTRKVVVQ